MVLGANTYQAFAQMLTESNQDFRVRDPWVTRMRQLPATVLPAPNLFCLANGGSSGLERY